MAGRIHRMVALLEREKSAFAVSRVIMLSGVSVRNYTATSPDEADAVAKVEAAVRQLLSDEELEAFERKVRE